MDAIGFILSLTEEQEHGDRPDSSEEHGKRYGYYRSIQRDKEKAFKKERCRYYINKQDQLDKEGEESIKYEDYWLGDITDGYYYDDYLDYKETNKR